VVVAVVVVVVVVMVVMVVVVVVTTIATEYNKDAKRWMEEQKLRLYVNFWCPRNYLAGPPHPCKTPTFRGGGELGCPQLL